MMMMMEVMMMVSGWWVVGREGSLTEPLTNQSGGMKKKRNKSK